MSVCFLCQFRAGSPAVSVLEGAGDLRDQHGGLQGCQDSFARLAITIVERQHDRELVGSLWHRAHVSGECARIGTT